MTINANVRTSHPIVRLELVSSKIESLDIISPAGEPEASIEEIILAGGAR